MELAEETAGGKTERREKHGGRSHITPTLHTGSSLRASIAWCRNRTLGFPGGSVGKESACSAEDLGSSPESGKSPGEGNGNPLQLFLPGKIPWTEEPGRVQPNKT